MGIEVLPPIAHGSEPADFRVGRNIRFGLERQERGAGAVEAISREDGGPFASIWDFAAGSTAAREQEGDRGAGRGGAPDPPAPPRRGMLEVLPQAQAAGQKVQLDAQLGQGSFFDRGDDADTGLTRAAAARRARPAERLGEGDVLGLFPSSHPLKEVRRRCAARVECCCPT